MSAAQPLLQADALTVRYGKIAAVRNVALRVDAGQIVSIVGPNGAGKSSLLNALMGSVAPASGQIHYRGQAVHDWPVEDRVEHGLCLVPEHRALFGELSVADNLDLGAFRHKCWHRRGESAQTRRTRDWLLTVFPRLKERLGQLAGTLSGGEQQMLALGRALMTRPALLLLDEPSLGLAPLVVRDIFRVIVSLRERGVSVLLVEQNARVALENSDTCYVMEGGAFVLQGAARDLAQHPQLITTYLGAAKPDRTTEKGQPS